MKRFIYSSYTKFVAALLFTACISLTALLVTNAVIDYNNDSDIVYGFENDFLEARCFYHLLEAPSSVVVNAYYNSVKDDETVDNELVRNYIEEALKDLYCNDRISYYIMWNEEVFSNCGAESVDDVPKSEVYGYDKLTENNNDIYERSAGNSYRGFFLSAIRQFDKEVEVEVYTSVKNEHVQEYNVLWHRQEELVKNTFTYGILLLVAALILVIYLVAVCGKTKDGEKKRLWLDYVWIEVQLATVTVLTFVTVMVCVSLAGESIRGFFPYDMLRIIVVLLTGAASAIILSVLLSLVRNIKNKSIVSSSVCLTFLAFGWKVFVKLVKWLKEKLYGLKNAILSVISKKTGIILVGMLFVYTALIGICGIMTGSTPMGLVWGVVLFLFSSFVLSHRANDIDEIKKGAREIRNGNIGYKIPTLKSEDMKLLADDINSIGIGLEKSVSDKMRAEKLKTELITNVSHDLKTPLTSIISYTELLSKTEGLSEEAQDYVKIIEKKSERLKTLTQDLFDISKVQSGNEKINLERLDIALLINQSLGESDGEIKSSGLNFCVNIEKELFVLADGRKMSRVISNLISNALKYSMKNTRVFVEASKKGDEVIIEFKNIASYEMHFDAEEITGRFVRGDEARTSEGSGLGLAIAKSYTEACGGSFEVVIDGDLFKAIIRFN